MKMLFKQRLFSWFDSYDVYDEEGGVLFTVEGQVSWGHCLKIFDPEGEEVGTVNERILSFLPTFEIYVNDLCVGKISRELSFFKPRYNIDMNGWRVEGDILEWNYTVKGLDGRTVAKVTKEPFNWTDTYIIEVADPSDATAALMLVLAIDAEKCTRANV